MMIAIIVILLICALAVLATIGRKGRPELETLRKWSYAHRGLHGQGRPENSMAAFRAALEGGYGIELDIHLLKDGGLAVIHDSPLKRTTGCEGRVEDLTTEDLTNYRLEGTDETIPTFRQVLELYAGKAPLIIELKPVDGNHAALAKAAVEAMEGYEGPWCMESFDPRCIQWLKQNRPEVIRGQLAENFMKTGTYLTWPVRFALTHQLLNFSTRPDFVAYKYADRKTLSNTLCRKLWGLQGVSWTLRSKEEYDTAVAEGWIPIFENFIP